MTKLLAGVFIKNHKDISSPKIRNKYGELFGATGIILNIFLFVAKLLAGVLSNSISVTADAINNATDSASSIATLLGFKLSGKKADSSHPFGHGRIEYISGVIISLSIIFVGIKLSVSSVKKLFNPVTIDLNRTLLITLAVSVIVKFLMFLDGISLSKLINSPAVKATAVDSISDVISTTVVLISASISHFSQINADAIGGCAVALFIIYSGLLSLKETSDPLLGKSPSPELVEKINAIAMSDPDINGIHDLVIHDYGNNKTHISFHAEVSANSDPITIHSSIDRIENELSKNLGCIATIHADPFLYDDNSTLKFKKAVEEIIAKNFNNKLSIHDFRKSDNETHTVLSFDLLIPHGYNIKEAEIKKIIDADLKTYQENLKTVITFDKPYL